MLINVHFLFQFVVLVLIRQHLAVSIKKSEKGEKTECERRIKYTFLLPCIFRIFFSTMILEIVECSEPIALGQA